MPSSRDTRSAPAPKRSEACSRTTEGTARQSQPASSSAPSSPPWTPPAFRARTSTAAATTASSTPPGPSTASSSSATASPPTARGRRSSATGPRTAPCKSPGGAWSASPGASSPTIRTRSPSSCERCCGCSPRPSAGASDATTTGRRRGSRRPDHAGGGASRRGPGSWRWGRRWSWVHPPLVGQSLTCGGPVSCRRGPVGRWGGSPHPYRPAHHPRLIAQALEISPMTTFLVIRLRSGPDYDPQRPLEEQSGWAEHAAFMDGLVDDGVVVLGGPLADEPRVALVIEADDEQAVNATLDRDPWTGSHVVTDAVEPWTIRLDGRARR